MNWSEEAWERSESTYASILQMPFIAELANGSLPKEKFQYYIAQDSLYLEHFGRALAFIGVKAYDLQDALAYIRFAEDAIVVEEALHRSYFKEFGLEDKGVIQPACHHYIHFLRSTAAIDAVEVAMAATLPCFWIYKKVGDHIYGNQQATSNPYQQWINTYGGTEFSVSVEKAIYICDKAAQNTNSAMRQRMTEAFLAAARLEYTFWDAAYNLDKWK